MRSRRTLTNTPFRVNACSALRVCYILLYLARVCVLVWNNYIKNENAHMNTFMLCMHIRRYHEMFMSPPSEGRGGMEGAVRQEGGAGGMEGSAGAGRQVVGGGFQV